MCVVAGLVGVPGRIAICEGGESSIFRLGAHDDSSGNPCVPHRSICLSVCFFIVSKAGLAVNIMTVTACDRQVVKSTISPRIAAMNNVVERGVEFFVGNVVARQTIQELLEGMLLCRFDGGGW